MAPETGLCGCKVSKVQTSARNGHDLTYNLSSLIAKWKKPGYEKLCCVRCIQSKVSLHFHQGAPLCDSLNQQTPSRT